MSGKIIVATSALTSSAENLGYMAGFWGAIAIFGLGIAKCISISLRPRTSSLCAISLALVLSTVVLGNIITWVEKTTDVGPLVRLLFAVLILVVAMIGIVLAIVGLAQYSGKGRDYNQGKSQAIWAIISGGFFMLLVVVGVVEAFNANQPKLANSPLKAGTVREFEETNFKFTTPESPWVEVDKNVVNSIASICFMRSKPQVFFMIVGENGAGLDTMTFDTYTELIRGNVRSACHSVEATETETTTIGGLEFQRFEVKGLLTGNNQKIFYVGYTSFQNGYFHQLLTWATQGQETLVRKEAEEMVAKFSILNPNQKATAPAGPPVKDVRLEPFGVATNLSDKDWSEWATLETDQEGKLFGAMKGENAYFLIDTVDLGDLDAEGDDLIAGLISRQGFEWPDDEVSVVPATVGGANAAWDVRAQSKFEGLNLKYLIRIVRKGNKGYMLAGWYKDLLKDGDIYMKEAIENVEFFTPQGEATRTPNQIDGQSDILNQIGLAAFKREEYETALPFFQAAYEVNPKDSIKLRNACEAYLNLEEYGKGLTYLNTKLEAHPDDKELLGYQAYLTGAGGDLDAALPMLVKLYESGYKDDDDLLRSINLYVDAERPLDAMPFTEASIANNPSSSVERWLYVLYARADEYDKAIEKLKQLVEKYPNDEQCLYTLGETCNDGEDYAQAESVAAILQEKGYDSARTAQIKGWSEYGRKFYTRAHETFQAAATKFPDNDALNDALRSASAALGRGSNREVSKAISPVEMPEYVTRLLSDIEPSGDDRGQGAYYRSIVTGVDFQKGKTQKSTTWVNVLIKERSEIDRFSTLYFSFDPLSEQLFLNELKVLDSSGKVVAEGKLEDFYVTDESDNEADNDKYLNVPVPGLKKGYTLQYSSTRETLGVSNEPEFSRKILSSSLPQDVRCEFITGDVELVKHRTNADIEFHSDKNLLVWTEAKLPEYKWETMQPSISDFLPMVTTGPGEDSWKKIGGVYLQRINERLELSDEVRNIAKNLVKEKKGDDEKIAAIAQFVRSELEYKAIEFGVRGRMPNKTSQILSDKYGDCKDHSLLLYQLFKAADIEARLALVNTGWDVVEEMPTLDQFNHMIVYLPEYGGGTFIDGTDQYLASSAGLPPVGLGGRFTLVLDSSKGCSLVKIGEYPKESERLESRRTVSMTDGLDALVEETITFNGYDASSMRSYLLGAASVKHEKRVHDLIASDEPIQIESLEILELDNPAKPLQMKMKYRVGEAFQRKDEVLGLTLPSLWESYYLSPSHVKDRKNPFFIEQEFTVKSEILVKLDRPIPEELISSFTKVSDGKFCKVKIDASSGDSPSMLSLQTTVKTVYGKFKADEYAKYEKERRAATKLLSPVIEVNAK
jgi:tetratricopeptide (TPR) repeat protein